MTAASKGPLELDYETYCGVDIREVGVYAYVASPDFEVLLLSFCYGEGEIMQIDVASGGRIPDSVISDLLDPNVVKIAHNASFERVVSTWLLTKLGYGSKIIRDDGGYLSPIGWFCTAVRASQLGAPRSLDEAGKAFGLPEEDAKYAAAGKLLVNYFCKPCKPTRANGGRTRNRPKDDPAKWELFKRYNRQDVVAERALLRTELDCPDPHGYEEALYAMDQRINDRGVGVDMALVDSILAYTGLRQDALAKRAKELTKLENPNSLPQVKGWLASKGVKADTLRKEDFGPIKKSCKDRDVLEYIAIREELGKTSLAKYDAMKRAAVYDPATKTWRVRGTLQFYGAMRTGRWAGRIIQTQNLPRNSDPELDYARKLARSGDWGTLELLWANPTDIISQLIRTAIVAAPGKSFVVADYSQIECRTIAYLANEQYKLDAFAAGHDLYSETASKVFGIPLDKVTHDIRAKGKIAELAGGYGGGVMAYKRMGADKAGLTDGEIQTLVDGWRKANPGIVELWHKAQSAMEKAIRTPGVAADVGVGHNLAYKTVNGNCYLRLPSGRLIAYRGARIGKSDDGRDEIEYMGDDRVSGHYELIRGYGGLLVENMNQAMARDCLGLALLRVSEKGYRPLFHVHDEMIVEVDEGKAEEAQKDILETMRLADVPWLKGLTLTAESYICGYYKKD